jgi:hypothetical protein
MIAACGLFHQTEAIKLDNEIHAGPENQAIANAVSTLMN